MKCEFTLRMRSVNQALGSSYAGGGSEFQNMLKGFFFYRAEPVGSAALAIAEMRLAAQERHFGPKKFPV